MAIKTTLKLLVESIDTGSLHKLSKDPNLSQTTKFLIDPIWKQAREQYEAYRTRIEEIGAAYGHLEMFPTDEDPNRMVYVFDTVEANQANDKEIKELLKAPVSIRGAKLTLEQLKRTAFQQTPRGMKAIDANTLDPLDADDYGRLDWLIDRPTEEVTEDDPFDDDEE